MWNESRGAASNSSVIAAQLRHTVDLLKAEIKRTNIELAHYKDLSEHRLNDLETCKQDHEQRIRRLQESSTQFKVLAGLATGGGLLSLINFIRALSS